MGFFFPPLLSCIFSLRSLLILSAPLPLRFSRAEMAEKARAVQTCHSIVRETIGMGIEATDRKHTWMDDAENCVSNG